MCWQWLGQAASRSESQVNFLFWNIISFSGCYIFLFVRFPGPSASSVSALWACFSWAGQTVVFFMPHTFCNLMITNQSNGFARHGGTTHSPFALPNRSILSLTRRWNATRSPHLSSAREPFLRSKLKGHYITFCKISEWPTVLCLVSS